jgi:hypothetical protein
MLQNPARSWKDILLPASAREDVESFLSDPKALETARGRVAEFLGASSISSALESLRAGRYGERELRSAQIQVALEALLLEGIVIRNFNSSEGPTWQYLELR